MRTRLEAMRDLQLRSNRDFPYPYIRHMPTQDTSAATTAKQANAQSLKALMQEWTHWTTEPIIF